MTIIVFDPAYDSIHVDSRMTWSHGGPPTTGSKIEQWDGFKVVFSGNSVHWRDNQAEIIEAVKTQKAVKLHDAEHFFEGFARLEDGLVLHIRTGKDYVVATPYVYAGVVPACGSGSAWFYAYMAEGKSIPEAFDMVCKYHAECGLPHERF